MLGSLFVVITGLIIFDSGTIADGRFYGLWNMGNMCFMGGVIITNFKLLAISNSISIASIICYVLSFFNFFWFWDALNLMQQNDLYNTYYEILKSSEFFIFIVVITGLS